MSIRFRLLLIAAVMAGVLSSTTGCAISGDPQSYMRPPRLPAEKQTLKARIEQSLPPGAVLIAPQTQVGDGTIQMVDLDGDGQDEAIAFYDTPEQQVRLHGMIWGRTEGDWEQRSVFDGEGFKLESVAFTDMTGDGKPDILAGYSAGSDFQKALLIYSPDDAGQARKWFEASYYMYAADDLNQDGRHDLTIVELERNTSSTAVTYQYTAGQMAKIGEVQLNPYINGYSGMVAGALTPKLRGVLLDTGIGAHSAYTELIVYEEGNLRSVFNANDNPTFSPVSAASADINGDGILEMSVAFAPSGWEDEAIATTPWFHAYYQWDGSSGLQKVSEQYFDFSWGFYVDFPSEWQGNVTLERNRGQNEGGHADPEAAGSENSDMLRFVQSRDHRLLAEIRRIPLNEWPALQSGWTELLRSDQTVVALKNDLPLPAADFHRISELK